MAEYVAQKTSQRRLAAPKVKNNQVQESTLAERWLAQTYQKIERKD